jgi:putative ABC transport system permease protein
MGYIDRKMRRDLWRMKGRAIASVLLITMGAMLYVSFMAMMPSVQNFFYDYYEESDFTDFEVYVNYAPLNMTQQLEAIPGVEAVEPRLIFPATVALSGTEEVAGQLYGVNSSREMLVNRLTVTSGDYLDSSDLNGILLDYSFAGIKEYVVGDQIEVVIQNVPHTYTIRGLVVSPEFLFWAIDPDAMIPLPGTLGIIFMPLETLQQAIPAYAGAVNQFSFLLDDDLEEEAKEDIVEALYPPLLVLNKEDIPVYTLIREDIEQGGGSTGAIALIFLLVAFFVVYSAYTRLVASQRREIGVLRGLGYSRGRILFSYIYLAALTGLIGSILGVILSIPLGFYLTDWYIQIVFGLTSDAVSFDVMSAVVGILFGPITAGLAAALATVGIIRLEAHEAIRGSTVDMKLVKKTILERIFGAFRGKKLSYATIYMSRNLSRRKVRSGLMILAIGGSFVLGVMGPALVDAMVVSVDISLDEIEKWDLLVEFTGTANQTQVDGISDASIDIAEPILRVAGTFGVENTPISLIGIPLDAQLHAFKMDKGREFTSTNEMVVSSMMAKELEIGVGNSYDIGGLAFQVTGVAKDFQEGFFIPISQARTIANANNSTDQYATALWVKATDGQITEAEDYLRTLPFVSSVTEKTEVSQGLKDLLSSFGAAMYIFSMIGILMTVLVVTNIVMISVMERYVEYGQMKAIGYRQKTVRRIVLSEVLILAIAGVVIGVPLYWLVGEWFAVIMEEFFSFYENIIVWEPIIGMAIVTVIVALLAALPAVRHLGKMEVATVISERQFG